MDAYCRLVGLDYQHSLGEWDGASMEESRMLEDVTMGADVRTALGSLDERVFQQIKLPIVMGGMGMAQMTERAPAAFLASVCQSLAISAALASDSVSAAHASSPAAAAGSVPDPVFASCPLYHSLSECHASVLERFPPPSPHSDLPVDLLPSTLSQLLRQSTSSLAALTQLQHKWTVQVERADRARFLLHATQQQQAMMTSASTHHASHLFSLLPDEDALLLPCPVYKLAVRARLGLPPRDVLPDVCGLCSKRVDEVERVHHQHICMTLKRKECLVRHNLLLRTLVEIAQAVNYICQKEPVRVRVHADGESKQIPDLLMLSPSPGVGPLYVDTTMDTISVP